MTSERLESLILMSSEKAVLDEIKPSSVVDRFASSSRGLPL